MGAISNSPPAEYNSETYTAPESGKEPLSKEGGTPIPPVTSVHPKATDNLLEALQSASIVKIGLTDTCNSFLTGFEVSDTII